jgi:hypothetical protein
MSNVSGSGSYDLSADVLSLLPDHTVDAVLAGTIAGEKQFEFIGKVESIGINPHAAVGNVGDKAVARRRTIPDLYSGQTREAVTLRLAPLHYIWQGHDARLRIAASPERLATDPLKGRDYRTAIAGGVMQSLGFASNNLHKAESNRLTS